ncbi:MAG: choice-of-anchor Q domain-containing protein, partial [Candidatus Aminicenantes bacterium]
MRKTGVFQIIFIVLWIFWLGTWAVVHAATIDVTTTRDSFAGSLRAAITTANSNNEDDTINLPAGTYFLSGGASEDANASGDLDINTSHNITIIGEGEAATFIDGNQIDRVLHILKGSVFISGVTIKNGKARDSGDYWTIDCKGEDGGGIYNHGTLTLTDCAISTNSAGSGSDCGFCDGGNGGGIFSDDELTLINCIVNNNIVGHGSFCLDFFNSDGLGGGIYNSGTLEISGCSISNNISGANGSNQPDGGEGGGIFNSGVANLANCTINNNHTGGGADGGGIYSSGTATLTDCTVSNNKAGDGFGDDYEVPAVCPGWGGGIYTSNTITLKRCLISNNKAGDGQDYYILTWGGGGGGICCSGKKATLTNCTISNNRSGDGGLGFSGNGGGISAKGELTLINCTVCNNRVGEPGQEELLYGNGGSGGGIRARGVNIKNTIIANNHANLKENGPDCWGEVNSLGYNLIEDINGCTITGNLTGNITGQDPMLGSLADNGGLTQTHALLPGSPAIDVGNSQGIYEDQRGYARPVNIPGIPNVSDGSDIGAYEYEFSSSPYISLNRTQLNFGGDTAGTNTGPKTFFISNRGGGTLNWSVTDDADWLYCTPTSGTNSAVITVLVYISCLSAGTYTGIITVEDQDAYNSPQTVTITLKVYNSGSTQSPFGSFDTPIAGSTVMSSVPFTGWVLDDIDVESVKIYRETVTGEGDGLVYIGDALFLEGARPDVQQRYPDYPNNYKAGWGYMMLTNFLPDGGNGYFTFHVVATDWEDHEVTLGTKTVFCDNQNAVKPFGTIDTPEQGDTASGSSYVNFGWALTPLPNTIPTDGSTITVWVDGVPLGHPVYNRYREDITTLFPNYKNSDGAGGHFYLDTSQYENGLHTISWSVTDNAGNTDGIGSRYFRIQNPGGTVSGKAQ